MKRILAFLLVLITSYAFFPLRGYSHKKTETITPDEEYGLRLERPAASMILKYKGVVDELIFEEGNTHPTLRILDKSKGKDVIIDTLLYNESGKIVRLGKNRSYKIRDRRVEYYHSRDRYFFNIRFPFYDDKEASVTLTDFDAEGNWKRAYLGKDTKNTLVTRTIGYKLTPEQENLLQQYKPILAEAEKQNQFRDNLYKVLSNGTPLIGIALLLLCLMLLGMKNAGGGKLRWILILVIGIPGATLLFYGGESLIKEYYPEYRFYYALIALVIYMLSMRKALSSMADDRRISDGFLMGINVVWSIWAAFVLCPGFMVTVMPNLVGKFLGWVLAFALFIINMLVRLNRCPNCRNPHGLEFYKSESAGVITEHSSSGSVKRSDPRVTDYHESGYNFYGKTERDVTKTDTYTTKKYAAYRHLYKCRECGSIVDRGIFKGELLETYRERVTSKGKETTHFDGHY